MTEKTDLQPDDKLGVVTQAMGPDPITGLPMFRRFLSLHSNVQQKQHTVSYEEWLVCPNGKVYQEMYRVKEYKVVDIFDTVPPQLKYTYWFNQIGPMILSEIASSLMAVVPIDADSGFVR